MGFERSMADGEILRRLFGYAKPYLRQFIVVGFLVLFSISYDIASPLIVGYIEELVVGDFELKSLYVSVAVYAGVLVFSMASTYLQAVILQCVGQRITYPAYVEFYHMPLEAILGMYQAILPSADSLMKCLVIFNLPFTLVKGLLDAVLCMVIYKPLSPILHGRK